MKGHVYKRGKSYTYVIDLPNDPITNKRRQKSKGGFSTEKEAWAACHTKLSEINSGKYTEDENMLFSALLEMWLQEYAKNKLKPAVYEFNEMIINKRIIPELGNIKLRDLTPLKIQRFYNKMLQSYSSDYVKSIHSVVSKTLRRAFKWNLMNENIMEKVDPPRNAKKEMNIWTMEQCQHFLNCSSDHYMHIIFSLAIYTGMRRGEILGLRWKDINWESGSLSVFQTLTWTAGQGLLFQDTKTSNSNRSIALPERLLNDLKRQQLIVEANKQSNPNYNDLDLVCCRQNGDPIKPRLLLQHYDQLIKKAELPKIRFHDLRHTHATMLINMKVHPKIGAERLGQTTAMFMDRYAHVIESMQKEAAATIDKGFDNL